MATYRIIPDPMKIVMDNLPDYPSSTYHKWAPNQYYVIYEDDEEKALSKLNK